MNLRTLTCKELKTIRTDRRYTVDVRNAAVRELTRRDDQRRIKTAKTSQNIWGNINGYIGGRKVIEFGTDEIEAAAWLATALSGNLDKWSDRDFRNNAWLDAYEEHCKAAADRIAAARAQQL